MPARASILRLGCHGALIALGLPAPAARSADEPVERPLSHLRARAGAPLPLGERVVLGGWITHVCVAEHRIALLEGDAGQVFRVDDEAWLQPLSTGAWIRSYRKMSGTK